MSVRKSRVKISPFVLDPAGSDTLSDQLAENLRRAIAEGTYKNGDKLPGLRQMAKLCGTSIRVPIVAMEKLCADGLVKGRPRMGMVVLGGVRKVWRGHVLFISDGKGISYFSECIRHRLELRLGKSGWRVVSVWVSQDEQGHLDLSNLRDELDARPAMAFGIYCNRLVARMLKKSGVPFAFLEHLNAEESAGALGTVAFCSSAAVAEFVDECRRKNVKTVLQLMLEEDENDVEKMLSEAGISTHTVRVKAKHGLPRRDGIVYAAFDVLDCALRRSAKRLPDLVYFADDYLARGGLWAIASAGLVAPDDIRIVTYANRGNIPAYVKSLSRIEKDLTADADKLADAILAFLEGKRFPNVFLDAVSFVRGETF